MNVCLCSALAGVALGIQTWKTAAVEVDSEDTVSAKAGQYTSLTRWSHSARIRVNISVVLLPSICV